MPQDGRKSSDTGAPRIGWNSGRFARLSIDWTRLLEISPAFRQFAPGDSPDHNSAELDLLPALAVRGPPDIANHHLVSLGDHVLNRHVNVGKTPECRRQILFRPFR